jgi:hypothetical protein
MIAGLKPYPQYEESGVPWLGSYPDHWSQRLLWTISTVRAERNPNGGGQVHAPSLDPSVPSCLSRRSCT